LRFALGVGVATFAGAMLQQVVLMLVRRLLDRQGGSALIGQFQAAWAVGATYFGVVLGGLASFAFPRYAAATTPEALSREVDEAARLVLRAAPPIVFMAIALADLVIELLYSGQFAPATRLLAWQFVGDLPKALAWVLGGPLLYRGRVRATLVAEFFFSVVFVAGALLCVPLWGLEGVGFAYAAAYVAFLLLVRWLLQRECGVRREPSQLWWVLGLTLGAAALVVAVRSWPGARLLALPVCLAWCWRVGVFRRVAERARNLFRKSVPQPPEAHLQ
ncbi:MAG: polysaccharide biosynthesis C-terminal domain-containing protein, partial [Myxococcaceae bacterium]|nr:polysaccharide biosynthesis C-terminal domain-containing protein [Myxococcaceae bacterium]